MATPKFEMLAAQIREQIRTGVLKPGDKLPSITALKDAGHSYGTIRGAMLVLKTEGLIEGRQGDGVYVL